MESRKKLNFGKRHSDQVNEADDAPIVDNDTMETRILERGDIRKQPHSWYKVLCAPTHSLIAASFSVLGSLKDFFTGNRNRS